jgi:hypothetical protein
MVFGTVQDTHKKDQNGESVCVGFWDVSCGGMD